MFSTRTIFKVALCLTLVAVLSAPHAALAATLFLSPSSNSVTAGDVVRVRVLVNSGGEAINTSEGVLQFPTDVLDVVSVDKSASIFSIWVDEPTFSNQLGTVSFSGGLPSPGFSGVSGTVINVVFHAKRAGIASLSLSGATVRANDGLGTDVLRGVNGTTLTITAPKVVVPAPAPKPQPVVTPVPEPKPVEVSTTTPTTTPAVVPAVVVPVVPTSPLSETVTFSLGEFNINIMTLLIMMFFLTLGSFIAASFAWWRLYTYHAPRGHVSKKAVAEINRALRLFKEDMIEHLDALEAAKTKRQLTEEELTMKADMKTNFAVLEKYIEEELS